MSFHANAARSIDSNDDVEPVVTAERFIADTRAER